MQDPNLEFRLPSAGDGALKAEIIQWFVAVGDRVSAGQPICSVETDKSMVDLTSPFTGEIASLGAEVGEVIEVGAVLVTAAGEPADDPTSNEAFSPLVRRLAEEFGVELSSLAGTGPDGRVTRADVQRAAFGTEISDTEHQPSPLEQPGHQLGTTLTVDTQTATDHTSIPAANRALTLFRDVDVEQLLRAHERLSETIGGGLPLEALLMRLALPALVEHPRMNARVELGLDGAYQLIPADHYDMAFSCITDSTLSVPVVRQVNDRSLRALGRSVTELARKASRGRLEPDELGRQTFTVHNLGPLGVTAGTTTLPTGVAALVCYGRHQPVLRLVDGAPREIPMMTVAITVDHRLIDDGEAARFLAKIALYLEDPILAFTD